MIIHDLMNNTDVIFSIFIKQYFQYFLLFLENLKFKYAKNKRNLAKNSWNTSKYVIKIFIITVKKFTTQSKSNSSGPAQALLRSYSEQRIKCWKLLGATQNTA